MVLPIIAAVGAAGIEGGSAVIAGGTVAAVGAEAVGAGAMEAVKAVEAVAVTAEKGVTGAALRVANFVEQGLEKVKQGAHPQGILEKLSNIPEVIPENFDITATVVKPEVTIPVPQNTEVTSEAQKFIDQKTETSLAKWDEEHHVPDKNRDPEAYKQWCQDRWQAEQDFIVDTKTDLIMQDWDKQNPEPDKAADSKGHEDWTKKREEQKSKLKDEVKKETKKQKESEMAEVMEKINRLKMLYQERMDIIEGIKAVKGKPEKTEQDKIDLAKFQVRKSELDTAIKILETDLKSRAGRAAPLVTLTIMTALMSMMIYKIGQEQGTF
ncbi:MAG: hypothetical protein HYW86_05010 [Candidatus Roizmanbacteria bacterium]|nr:MAG: hypothetical protein HYW86_05010 [Candidatus Roizmanbacteria bacterium]